MNDRKKQLQTLEEYLTEFQAGWDKIEADFKRKREEAIQEVIDDPNLPFYDREEADDYLDIELDIMKDDYFNQEITFTTKRIDEIENQPESARDIEEYKDCQEKRLKLEALRAEAEDTNESKVADFLKEHYDIRYNTVLGTEWIDPDEPEKGWQKLTDRVDNTIEGDARTYFKDDPKLFRVSKRRINHVIMSRYFEPYDPFIYYFNSIIEPWDGKTDYIKQVAELIEVEQEDRGIWPEYFKKWFIGMIAQMRMEAERGNQLMLLLLGKGGKGKTYWLESLAIERKYSVTKNQLKLESKDGEIIQTEKQIVVADEADNIIKTQLNILKSLITSNATDVRLPYARRSERLPRRASYCGASNYRKLLTDQTGNRRFLPFWVENILGEPDEELKKKAYAQGHALLNKKEKYWLDFEAGEKLTERNKRFMVGKTHIRRDNSGESISNEQAIHNTFTAATKDTEGAQHFIPSNALEIVRHRYPEVTFRDKTEFGKVMSNILPDAEKKNKKYDGKSCMGYWLILK